MLPTAYSSLLSSFQTIIKISSDNWEAQLKNLVKQKHEEAISKGDTSILIGIHEFLLNPKVTSDIADGTNKLYTCTVFLRTYLKNMLSEDYSVSVGALYHAGNGGYHQCVKISWVDSFSR